MLAWVADAPHHAADAPVMVQDILAASGLGVRLYPIAASGTDDLLEYTMRTAAEVTGGATSSSRTTRASAATTEADDPLLGRDSTRPWST